MYLRGKMKKVLLILGAIIIAGLSVASLVLFMKTKELGVQVARSRADEHNMLMQVNSMQQEKEKLAKENEKLNADAISYIALNARLQQEKEKIQNKLNNSEKSIGLKEADLDTVKQKLKKLEKKVTKEGLTLSNKYGAEKSALLKKIKDMEANIKEQKSTYYYNLAVAYTKANLYDDAISAYEKSLEIKSDNPDAYYNLGLLYDSVKGDASRAIDNYRLYLKLKPDAEDKEDVESLIEKLK